MNEVMNKQAKNVAFLVYDQVEVLDLNGPLDVFVKANVVAPGSYNCYTVGLTKEAVFAEANTMAILPTYAIADAPKPDILVVPGANPDHIMRYLADVDFQGTVLTWVKQQYDSGSTVFPICTGSMLLSNTGILDGHAVTTHSMLLDKLEEVNPASSVQRGVRYVDDGKLISTAGITAGIDAALYVVKKDLTEEVSNMIVTLFEYKG